MSQNAKIIFGVLCLLLTSCVKTNNQNALYIYSKQTKISGIIEQQYLEIQILILNLSVNKSNQLISSKTILYGYLGFNSA